MTAISTLRPGLLVGLSTRLTGNVQYTRRDIESDHYTGEGTRKATWETDRVINDPAEFEEATKVRSKARSLITAVCAPSSFGLLCPESARDRLLAAVDKARELVNGFNARAAVTRIGVYAIVGRVASDDAEAVRAINSEVRELLESMESGLQRLDVKAVRDAADKARQLASMLTPEAAERAQRAIEVARSAARRIVKASEAAAIEIDAATLRTIRASRSAFLDLDEAAELQAPSVQARAIDIGPDAPAPMIAAPSGLPSFSLDLGE